MFPYEMFGPHASMKAPGGAENKDGQPSFRHAGNCLTRRPSQVEEDDGRAVRNRIVVGDFCLERKRGCCPLASHEGRASKADVRRPAAICFGRLQVAADYPVGWEWVSKIVIRIDTSAWSARKSFAIGTPTGRAGLTIVNEKQKRLGSGGKSKASIAASHELYW